MGFTSINFARCIHIGLLEYDEPYIKTNKDRMGYCIKHEKELS